MALFGRSAEVAFTGVLWTNYWYGDHGGVAQGAAARILEPFSRSKEDLFQPSALGLRGQLGDLATFFNYRLDVFVVNYFSARRR